ncbi:dTMP kinase [Metallosphaera hakonensis]|uniref:Thymidylate kinase n=1 Tax=Metallosphaera hakonensis JCM 8857 = DSM 7519 TaxID=1293036 RepID=A0A2U9IR31_9CREN|nr:thymidylate kinase [Metallosphaera hakonensis]AWR98501.1 thymidylate kinase [Metallosphaera hakonensis JCM 8857 = DSM 7519]
MEGKIIALEGSEGSGRTYHSNALKNFLEEQGYGVVTFGLGMSKLMGEPISRRKRDIVFQRRTLFLAYVTDIADQVENVVRPMVKAGFIALADGYVSTLMAWGLTRGLEEEWMRDVLSALPKANISLGLISNPDEIMRRILRKKGVLDPFGSGIDICINGDLFSSYRSYLEAFQAHLRKVMEADTIVDTSRDYEVVRDEIARIVGRRIEA